MANEFDLIEQIRRRSGGGSGVVLGIGDDAAVLRPRTGTELVATTDSLVAGRHFRAGEPPSDLGHLALAVNLSDLAAMGASPRWALLNLTLPTADGAWLDPFLDGFLALATATGCSLVGGNLARGPLNIAVTALGEVESGRARGRRGARCGDCLVVTGTLGDAAAALELDAPRGSALHTRLLRPEPRLRAGQVLAEHALALIDISDGLIVDLARLTGLETGAVVECARLPASQALVEAVPDPAQRWRWQLAGGGDYELLAALPPQIDMQELAAACGVAVTGIGHLDSSGQIRCLDPDGRPFDPGSSGWDHFGVE